MGGNLKESLKNQTKHCFPKKLETLLKVTLNQVGEGRNESRIPNNRHKSTVSASTTCIPRPYILYITKPMSE